MQLAASGIPPVNNNGGGKWVPMKIQLKKPVCKICNKNDCWYDPKTSTFSPYCSNSCKAKATSFASQFGNNSSILSDNNPSLQQMQQTPKQYHQTSPLSPLNPSPPLNNSQSPQNSFTLSAEAPFATTMPSGNQRSYNSIRLTIPNSSNSQTSLISQTDSSQYEMPIFSNQSRSQTQNKKPSQPQVDQQKQPPQTQPNTPNTKKPKSKNKKPPPQSQPTLQTQQNQPTDPIPSPILSPQFSTHTSNQPVSPTQNIVNLEILTDESRMYLNEHEEPPPPYDEVAGDYNYSDVKITRDDSYNDDEDPYKARRARRNN
nr:10901_t:CDS:2 [Entrophospora candida]